MYKELYEALEADDKLKHHVEKLKGFSTKLSDSEAKVRKLETDFKAFEGVDIAKLRADAELIEKNGGAEKVLALVAKANGYDADMTKTKSELEEYKAQMQKFQTEAEARTKDLEIANLRNEVLPRFTENFNGSNDILDLAIGRGLIAKGDKGIVYKNGDVIEPLETGFEKLKEQFKYALKTPPAGDGQGGVNRGNGNNNGERVLSMAEKLAARHRS
jgi:hypothetical protein